MAEELGRLVPTGGGDPIPLLKHKLLIGRRGPCDIALKFPNVSSRHCELELVNGYWQITDVGSTNGIKVNGNRCSEKFLMPGDTVTIAKHRYEISYSPDPSAPIPIEEEEDVFAKSLLEKAGLERMGRSQRPRRVSPSAETPPAIEIPDPPASRPRRKSGPASDDDAALDFLNE